MSYLWLFCVCVCVCVIRPQDINLSQSIFLMIKFVFFFSFLPLRSHHFRLFLIIMCFFCVFLIRFFLFMSQPKRGGSVSGLSTLNQVLFSTQHLFGKGLVVRSLNTMEQDFFVVVFSTNQYGTSGCFTQFTCWLLSLCWF